MFVVTDLSDLLQIWSCIYCGQLCMVPVYIFWNKQNDLQHGHLQLEVLIHNSELTLLYQYYVTRTYLYYIIYFFKFTIFF